MNKGLFFAGAVVLAAAIVGPARGENVIQLTTTLKDPSKCGNQLDPANPAVTAYNYMNIATNVNYTMAKGDRLVYDVLIPAESTMNAGAIDMNLTASPKSESGKTLRDNFSAVDENGLFAHPGSDYGALSTRLVTTGCDASGKPVTAALFQRGQWLHRVIDLTGLSVDAKGGPVAISSIMLAVDEHDSTHVHDVCPTDPKNANAIALFRNINIWNTDAAGKRVVKQAIYNGEAKLPTGDVSSTTPGAGAPGQNNTTGSVGVIDYKPATNPTATNPTGTTPKP